MLRLRRLRLIPRIVLAAPTAPLSLLDEATQAEQSWTNLVCQNLTWLGDHVQLPRELMPCGPASWWVHSARI
eukprot:7448861-Pyramimonas_sp.AAC.1